jgi:hypothetical protein
MAPSVRIVDLDIDASLLKPVRRPEFVALVRSLLGRRRPSDPVERYVSALSKRAALLKTESPAVLRSDPTHAAFLKDLSQLARRVDRCPDDPYLDRIPSDAGRVETSPGTTD